MNVRLFAVARQRAGQASVAVDLPDPATVADLKNALAVAIPSLAPLVASLMFSIDTVYADQFTPILADSDVAAIPPVSGGAGG